MLEKRNFTRIAFDARARLLKGESDWATHLLDISLKGALVELPSGSALKTGDVVSLHLLLSDEETEINMEGHVVHQEGNHVGLVCDHIDVDSVSHLRRIVELNTGSEALLEREFNALTRFGKA